MKVFIIGFILLTIVLVLFGCQVYSWMILENPEFPDALSPLGLNEGLLSKYSVGDVIVKPSFWHVDGNQTNYQLVVMFFCKVTNNMITIESALVTSDNKILSNGLSLTGKQVNNWALYKGNKPFYTSFIKDIPIASSKSELVKSKQIDVSLMVVVDTKNNKVFRKHITAHFIPRKRSYIE